MTLYVVLWVVLRVARLFNACVLYVIDCVAVLYVCCVCLCVCVCLCALVCLMCLCCLVYFGGWCVVCVC